MTEDSENTGRDSVRNRKWRAENTERDRERKRAWRERNRERDREQKQVTSERKRRESQRRRDSAMQAHERALAALGWRPGEGALPSTTARK